jgi:regulator of sirC expression with transglutaminase-like and TPR domain
MSSDPLDYLKRVGESGSDPLDIAHAALMLAALDHPERALEPYLARLREIDEAMKAQSPLIVRAEDGAQALVDLLVRRLGYDGDRLEYDDPRNADLIAVIDRRRGLPVALGILYMHAARASGMGACGLNTQGHFLIRVSFRHNELTLDPFNNGAILTAANAPPVLRDAPIAEAVSDVDVLLRLVNNQRIRALERGQPERALEIARRMTLIAPRRPDLWFDLGRINAALGVLGAARKAYEHCLGLAPAGEALHNEAVLALGNLKRRLN